jgi:nickel/cobalt transporter (NicO) family protein
MKLSRLACLKGVFFLGALFVLIGVSTGRHPQVVSAHPLGNFTINHYSRIELATDQVTLQYALDMAEIPTFQERALIDRDQDSQLSEEERIEYLESRAQALKNGLELLVNGNSVKLQVVTQELNFPSGQGGLPTLRIDLLLQGPLALAGEEGEQTLYYQDDNYLHRLGWKEIVVKAREGISLVNSTVPEADLSNGLRTYPKDMLSSPPNASEARSTFVLGSGNFSQISQSQPGSATGKPNARPDEAFTSLITAERLTLPVVVLSLVFALGLGAAHALSPGHGKTIMAAYLVGARGTVKHALFLGLTVTLSHSLGVLALGGVALYASSLIAPDRLYPWLGLSSGVTILGIGVWLLICRVRQDLEQHHHHHSHDHHHHHWPNDSNKLSLTWKNLTALGVVGGLVPSASALVILLAAISLHRLSFGLLLIFAFSAGMAAVLAGVGLVLVYAGKAVERVGFQHRWIASLANRIPLLTALVVLVSGLVLAVRAALQIGLV